MAVGARLAADLGDDAEVLLDVMVTDPGQRREQIPQAAGCGRDLCRPDEIARFVLEALIQT